MTKTLLWCWFVLAAVALPANASFLLTTNLSGSQEVPANSSSATGNASVFVDTDDNTVDFSLVVNGINLPDLQNAGPNPSPIHIHLAPAGSNGGIVIDVGFQGVFAAIAGGFTLTQNDVPIGPYGALNPATPVADIIAALRAGNTYVNVHTQTFPGGEIRGQLSEVPEPSTVLLSALGLLGLVAVRRRMAR